MGKHGSFAAWVATFAIGTAALLSLVSLKLWLTSHPVMAMHDAEHSAAADHATRKVTARQIMARQIMARQITATADHGGSGPRGSGRTGLRTTGKPRLPQEGTQPQTLLIMSMAAATRWPKCLTSPAIGTRWRSLGKLKLTIGYYIDALTIAMFCMVTLIATCIHFYAMGYMHDELHDFTDHEVTPGDGTSPPATGTISIGSSSSCRCFASACWDWSSRAISP